MARRKMTLTELKKRQLEIAAEVEEMERAEAERIGRAIMAATKCDNLVEIQRDFTLTKRSHSAAVEAVHHGQVIPDEEPET
jgi:hypothetical protein